MTPKKWILADRDVLINVIFLQWEKNEKEILNQKKTQF